MTTSDSEWHKKWQRVTKSDRSDNEWKRMTTSGTTNESDWEQVTESDFGFRIKQNM